MTNKHHPDDIAVENLEFDVVQDLDKSQDLQILQTTSLADKRDQRCIFLESENRYVHSKNFNEHVLGAYAQQILTAFPEAGSKVNRILEQKEPSTVSQKVIDSVKEAIKIGTAPEPVVKVEAKTDKKQPKPEQLDTMSQIKVENQSFEQ